MAKHFDLSDIAGPMDTRSSPDAVLYGSYRYVKNFGVVQKKRVCRLPGWTKLLDRPSYNNQDLRTQLIDLIDSDSRRYITFLYEAESTFGTTKLLAATDRALYALNISTGNWKVIKTGFGADNLRLYGAQNQDNVIFTNDYDKPFYWNFDQPNNDSSTESVAEINDLNTKGITRASVVITWSGCTFLMNLVQDGRTFGYRIVWSDFQNGLSYIESKDSVAGNQDLDNGEVILAALPMANVLLIYTTRGIWQCNQTGDPTTVFGFSKRYDAKNSGEACLTYRNTLTSIGNEHFFAGQEGLYTYSLFKDKPELVEWIHKGSSLIFDDINDGRCDIHVAAYNPLRREIWFSWAKSNEDSPSQTLVFNTQFPFSAVVDHGFSSYGVFQPKEPVTILQDFLLQNCICTQDELDTYLGDTQEGGFCSAPDAVVCADQPDSFYTTVTQEIADGDDDPIVTEDWNQVEPSANSLCSRLGSMTLSELCVAESKGACKPSRIFVMASTTDKCLKQMSDIYYREVCTAFTACGTYEKRGYRSLLRSGPINLKDTDNEKIVQRFVAEVEAAVATVPGQIKFRIGTSAQALDSNQTTCAIIWVEEDEKVLACLSSLSETQHEAQGTRPDVEYEWPTYAEGMYFYFELEIVNGGSTPFEDTGAAACLSRYTMFAESSARRI